VLAAKLIASGMGDGAAVNIIRGAYAQCAAKDERWQERYADIPRAVESARGKYEQRGEQPATAPAPRVWDGFLAWENVIPPEQEWTVPDLIPAREVCLFSGSGGAGKSTIALHLCAAHALGLPWLNWVPKQGPSFFIDCEDHLHVVWRRLDAVRRHYGCSFTDLHNGGLHILSLHGQEDILFATANRDSRIVPTPLYRWVLAEAARIKPAQIVLASSANIYAGSEIDRSQVTQFTGLLAQLAVTSGGSVILISHPSLAGMTNSSGLSGSTGWHDTVRARMYLESGKSGEGENEQPTNGPRLLKFMKNQYGPEAAQTALEYRNGIFLPPVAPTDYDLAARGAKAEELFMTLLRKTRALKQNLSTEKTARNYAPRELAKEREAKAAKVTAKDLELAMENLIARGSVRVVQYGYASRGTFRIEPL
jgi:RecA-family ATPase